MRNPNKPHVPLSEKEKSVRQSQTRKSFAKARREDDKEELRQKAELANEIIEEQGLTVVHVRPTRKVHLRNGLVIDRPLAKGGITVVCRKSKKGEDNPFDSVLIAYARCAPVDQYNRVIGRYMAANRFYGGLYFSIPFPRDKELVPAIHAMFSQCLC